MLSASGLVGLITQIPGGELIDITKARRAIVGAGAAAIALALLGYCAAARTSHGLRLPSSCKARLEVFSAQVSPPSASGSLGTTRLPNGLGAINASPLWARPRRRGFHGRDRAESSVHPGYLSCRPLRWRRRCCSALTRIRSSDIHFARSCGGSDHHAADPARVKRANLFKNSGLLIFAVCLLLFQLANASLLTQISRRAATR